MRDKAVWETTIAVNKAKSVKLFLTATRKIAYAERGV